MTNRYLEKIADMNSAIANGQSPKGNELAQVGTIGAVGYGSSVLTNKIGQKLNLLPKAEKATGSFLSRAGHFIKSPIGKLGLIGAGVGLAGDYAAVKANKAISGQNNS